MEGEGCATLSESVTWPEGSIASPTFLEFFLQRMKLFAFLGKKILQLSIVALEHLVVSDKRLEDFRDFRVMNLSRMSKFLVPLD